MKSYADDDLKFCFLLPVEDSDEEEVKGKLVKCENCQMVLKECDMKKHLSTHNLTKPFHCEVKGCFKKFNTEENLILHKKYFHNNDKYFALSKKRFNKLKNEIKRIKNNFKNDIGGNREINIDEEKENVDMDEYVVGKCTYEDSNGKVIDEKMFLSLRNKIEQRNNNEFNNNMILGYISSGLP